MAARFKIDQLSSAGAGVPNRSRWDLDAEEAIVFNVVGPVVGATYTWTLLDRAGNDLADGSLSAGTGLTTQINAAKVLSPCAYVVRLTETLPNGVTSSQVLAAVALGAFPRPILDGGLTQAEIYYMVMALASDGGGVEFSDDPPEDVGESADPGESDRASRADHRHAHGSLGGGSLHALAVPGGDAGFMSGTQAQQLENLASFVWSNAAARTAQVLTAGDLHKKGYQQDLRAMYEIQDDNGTLRAVMLLDPNVRTWRMVLPSATSTAGLPTVIGLAGSNRIAGSQPVRTPSAGTTKATRQVRLGMDGNAQLVAWRPSSSDAENFSITPSAGARVRLSFVINATVSATTIWVAIYIRTVPVPVNDYDPANTTQWIGVGRAAGQNLRIYHNDASGVSTSIDLGSDFPCVSGEGYEIDALTDTGAAWVVQVTRVNTGHSESRTLTTNLPTISEGGPYLWAAYSPSDPVSPGLDLVEYRVGALQH